MGITRIYIAGHRGMVGGAILRRLQARRDAGEDLALITRTHAELDLTDQAAVAAFFDAERPDAVILAAAKVGGIHANDTYPADFIYENLMIECNVIHQAYRAGVRRLLQLGSSCIYPRMAPQPMAEDALLTGTLEPTNEPYAIAKIAGIKLCESYNRQHGVDYRSVMPTNLYGPGDNFHPENSHVLPALIRRFHEAAQAGAESVTIWGTGTPRREFLHVDDMAAASLFVMDLDAETYARETRPMLSHINVGTGTDVSILELAQMVARATGFQGEILTDPSKPDGTPRKLMNVDRLARLGWRAGIALEDGIAETYAWFLAQDGAVRGQAAE
jgi:GDPmannose 4,6-dehydratase/GDP-L-fucose synthase